jgi:hypothetical protein
VARELIILPRFKRAYRSARKHTEFDPETLEWWADRELPSRLLCLLGQMDLEGVASFPGEDNRYAR